MSIVDLTITTSRQFDTGGSVMFRVRVEGGSETGPLTIREVDMPIGAFSGLCSLVQVQPYHTVWGQCSEEGWFEVTLPKGKLPEFLVGVHDAMCMTADQFVSESVGDAAAGR